MGLIEYHMDQIVQNLVSQKQYFHNLSEQLPPGALQIRKYKGKSHFVQSIPDENQSGGYRRRTISDDPDTLQAFANSQYGLVGLELIEHNESVINNFFDDLIEIDHGTILDHLPRIYRTLPEDMYQKVSLDDPSDPRAAMRDWAEQPYTISSYRPHERNKETSRGLLVRSKSEVLFCEKLYEYDLPFRYEQELIAGKYTLAPDFTFLDNKGNEYYVEYWGMMDDPDYIARYRWKRSKYEGIGIYEWDNLLSVFEKGNIIDMKHIDGVIRHQIMPRIL